MEMPKNFSPGLTSEAEILYTNRRVIYLDMNRLQVDVSDVRSIQLYFTKQATERREEEKSCLTGRNISLTCE